MREVFRRIPTCFKNIDLFVFLLLLAFGLWQFIRLDGYLVEDSYISMRYVQNLLEGHGWVFNVAQKYNAITSPLHLILMTVLGEMSQISQLPKLYHLTSYICVFVSSILMYVLFKKHNRFIGLSLAISMLLGAFMYDGMGIETSLNVTLVLALVCCLQNKKTDLSIIILTFLPLVRLENILFYPLVLLSFRSLFHEKLFNRKWAFYLFLPLMMWHVFSYIYYGKLLPETLTAKIWQGSSGHWGNGFVYLSDMWTYFTTIRMQLWEAIVTSVLSVFGIVYILKNRLFELLILIIFTLIHTAVYGLIFNVPGYYWYFVWIYLSLLIAAGFGTIYCIDFLNVKNTKKVILLICVYVIFFAFLNFRVVKNQYVDNRISAYKELGIWIKKNLPSNATILHDEVGTLAFYSEHEMVDTLGLLSPQYIGALKKGQVGFFWNFIFQDEGVDELYYVMRMNEKFENEENLKSVVYSSKDGLLLMKLQRDMFEIPQKNQRSLFGFDYAVSNEVKQKSINLLPSGKVCPAFIISTGKESDGVTFPNIMNEFSAIQFYTVHDRSLTKNGVRIGLNMRVEYEDGKLVEGKIVHAPSRAAFNFQLNKVLLDESLKVKNISIFPLDNSTVNDKIGVCNPVLVTATKSL